jgi:hypothetical protein
VTGWSRHHLRDGHPHVHGANLGIRGDTYLALGAEPSLRAGEDVELVRRAMAAGHLRISRTAAIPVLTSPRPFNRHARLLRLSRATWPGAASP